MLDIIFFSISFVKKIVYTRMEAPYTTECFSDWTQTNYSAGFLGTKSWPYSFMVI